MKEIENAPIELILVYPSDLFDLLKFVKDTGRKQFTESVGEFLNEMRASEDNKDDWEVLINRLDNGN